MIHFLHFHSSRVANNNISLCSRATSNINRFDFHWFWSLLKVVFDDKNSIYTVWIFPNLGWEFYTQALEGRRGWNRTAYFLHDWCPKYFSMTRCCAGEMFVQSWSRGITVRGEVLSYCARERSIQGELISWKKAQSIIFSAASFKVEMAKRSQGQKCPKNIYLWYWVVCGKHACSQWYDRRKWSLTTSRFWWVRWLNWTEGNQETG